MRYCKLHYYKDYTMLKTKHAIKRMCIGRVLFVAGFLLFMASLMLDVTHNNIFISEALIPYTQKTALMLYSSTMLLISMLILALHK